MAVLPPLPMLLASASTDVAKVVLDLKGWPLATELLRRHGLVPTSDWGKAASALGMVLANGILDWHMPEDTPAARFTKEILRDVPSELIARLLRKDDSPILPGPADQAPTTHAHPIFQMNATERTALLERIRTLDHPAQLRLRMLLGKLRPADLGVLAQTATADLGTILDLLAPPVAQQPSLGDRLVRFLVPNLGRN